VRKTMRKNVNDKFRGHTVKHAWHRDSTDVG
jgi:hypothetical protein